MKAETRLQRTNDVVATDMDGELVMMHIEKGNYFALTGSGGPIWNALETPSTLTEVIAFVKSEYDVEEVDDLERVISGFIEQLIDQGLVDRVD